VTTLELGQGGRLNVLDEGDGPPLLLMHGNPTSSALYRQVVDELSGEFRCIAPDLPGHGSSVAPDGYRFSPAEHAAVLERLVVELDLTGVTMVAQDWGGPTGFAVAGRQPERFDAFVVANTWAWPMDKRGAGTWSLFFSSPLGSRLMQELGARRWSRPELDAVKALARGVDGAAAFLRGVELDLPRLAGKRAAIVWGDADPVFGETELERWQALWPHAEVVRLPTAGHFVQESAPAELSAAIRSLS
jgi:haloalkane dehalogenase